MAGFFPENQPASVSPFAQQESRDCIVAEEDSVFTMTVGGNARILRDLPDRIPVESTVTLQLVHNQETCKTQLITESSGRAPIFIVKPDPQNPKVAIVNLFQVNDPNMPNLRLENLQSPDVVNSFMNNLNRFEATSNVAPGDIVIALEYLPDNIGVDNITNILREAIIDTDGETHTIRTPQQIINQLRFLANKNFGTIVMQVPEIPKEERNDPLPTTETRPSFTVSYGEATVNKRGERNQDRLIVSETFAAVLDGLGGETITPHNLIDNIQRYIQKNYLNTITDYQEAREQMQEMVGLLKNEFDGEQSATTLTAMRLVEDATGQLHALITSAGDSPAIIHRANNTSRIVNCFDNIANATFRGTHPNFNSDPEGVIAEAIEEQNLFNRKAPNNPVNDKYLRLTNSNDGHLLTSTIGRNGAISGGEARLYDEVVNEGDVIVLASDGLTDNLFLEEIENIIEETKSNYGGDPNDLGQAIADALIAEAKSIRDRNRQGKHKNDDITVTVHVIA